MRVNFKEEERETGRGRERETGRGREREKGRGREREREREEYIYSAFYVTTSAYN